MSVLERLRTKSKADRTEDAAEQARQSAKSTSDREGEALISAFDNADAVLAALDQELSSASLAVKLARAGTGDRASQTLAEVEADRVLAEVQTRRAAAYRRRTEAAVKLADHATTTREAGRAEEQAAQEEADAALAGFVPRLDAAFREVEALAAEALALLTAREKAWPTRQTVIAKNGPHSIMGERREGWDGRKAVLLGGGDPFAGAGLLFQLFRKDPHARYGGPLGLWRAVSEEAELLPQSEDTKARLKAEKQARADALVDNALRDDAVKRHLNRVWGVTDKRDYGMDGSK